jgi:hypothetical protein
LANAQSAFEGFECRLDLCQLHATLPQHSGVFVREVGPQKIASLTPARSLQPVAAQTNQKVFPFTPSPSAFILRQFARTSLFSFSLIEKI